MIAHGALTIAWVFLFVTQGILIAKGRKATHRRFGVFVALIAFASPTASDVRSPPAQMVIIDECVSNATPREAPDAPW